MIQQFVFSFIWKRLILLAIDTLTWNPTGLIDGALHI